MTDGQVRVTAEWALWGQAPQHRGYAVLACSAGVFSRADFTAIINRYGSGTPDELPQVTLGWAGAGAQAHLTLAIQEWSGAEDRLGRDLVSTRLFCVPYAQLTETPVGYEAIYEAFARLPLPVHGPLTVEIAGLRPADIAGRVTEPAMTTAALLLSRTQVGVVQAEPLPVLERLRFLDTVAALLPYGMRTRFTASTWTSSTSLHRIRLSFTRHNRDRAHTVVWGRPAELPDDVPEPRAYLDLLKRAPDRTTMIRRLAMTRRPLDFRDGGPALDLLGDIVLGREPAERPEPAERAEPAERPGPALTGDQLAGTSTAALVAWATHRPPDPLIVEVLFNELVSRGASGQDPDVGPELRRHGYLAGMLAELHQGDHDTQVRRLSELLRAAHGQAVGRAVRDEILDHPAAREHAALRAAAGGLAAGPEEPTPAARVSEPWPPERRFGSDRPQWPASPGIVVVQMLSSVVALIFVIALLVWLLS